MQIGSRAVGSEIAERMKSEAQSGELADCGSAAAVCAAALAPCLPAQVSRYDEKQMAPVSDKPPAILNGVGIAQHLNQQLAAGT